MRVWTEDEKRRFDEILFATEDEASKARARQYFAEGGSTHTLTHDPDPGPRCKVVDTPKGQAKVCGGESDRLKIWLILHRQNLLVPPDLTRDPAADL
jgi:hypothetical protein